MNDTNEKISMFIFISVYFLLYGGMHYYVYLKARSAFSFDLKERIVIMVFLLFMVYALVLVRISETAGLERIAKFTAYTGFYWMGFLFLIFCMFILFDGYRFLLFILNIITKKDFFKFIPSVKNAFITFSFLTICVLIYGFFEAKDIQVKRWSIISEKVPLKIGKIKIVQISDIHLGLIVGEERLKLIIEKVKKESPDILVSTGDLVDGQVCNLNGLKEMFLEIKPKYGKYAVTGNHEFYAGLDNALCFTEDAGFKMLRGRTENIGDFLDISGVDDPAGRVKNLTVEVSEKMLLEVLPRKNYRLFLKHQPIVEKESVGLFDLQLSGHTHGGQIFPFNIFTWLSYHMKPGQFNTYNGSKVYVSRGSGTWGPPVRFLSPPEVTVIEIVHPDYKPMKEKSSS